MTDTFNTTQVQNTLKLVVGLLNKYNVNYRFMGSILPTALNGSLYRNVNDFDILVDKAKVENLSSELVKLGFTRKSKNMFRVSEQLGLYVFKHPALLETSFFAVNIDKGEEMCLESWPFLIKIKSDISKATNYAIWDTKFMGIPVSTAYTIALISKFNPKRKVEFEVYRKYEAQKIKRRLFDMYFMGIKVNWLIDLLNLGLILVGELRVKFGMPYDLWR